MVREMAEEKEYQTIKYYKAKQLAEIEKSEEATEELKGAQDEDSVAVLIQITNPLKIEKAVNITQGGFSKVKELIPR